MKVIDLQLYRNKRIIKELEKRISFLYLNQCDGAAREIKLCFKQWVKANSK